MVERSLSQPLAEGKLTMPRQSRGHSIVSRSKRLVGVANAAPQCRGHLFGGRSPPQAELVQPLVLLLLFPDVFADYRLIATDRRDEVPARPEVLPHEVALALPIHPCQMNRALALDEADHLRHRVLRRDRDHHVHVIGHQVPFHDFALLLRGQLAKHLPKVPTQLCVQRPAPTLRDENHVILAVPCRVAQTFELVHQDSSFRVLGGSRLEVSTMDTPEYVKLLPPPRHSRGASFV